MVLVAGAQHREVAPALLVEGSAEPLPGLSRRGVVDGHRGAAARRRRQRSTRLPISALRGGDQGGLIGRRSTGSRRACAPCRPRAARHPGGAGRASPACRARGGGRAPAAGRSPAAGRPAHPGGRVVDAGAAVAVLRRPAHLTAPAAVEPVAAVRDHASGAAEGLSGRAARGAGVVAADLVRRAGRRAVSAVVRVGRHAGAVAEHPGLAPAGPALAALPRRAWDAAAAAVGRVRELVDALIAAQRLPGGARDARGPAGASRRAATAGPAAS